MAIKNSVETFSEAIEEKFKISEVKDKFHIEVSDNDIENYGDELLTLKEIQSIKEGNITVSQLLREKLRLSLDKTSNTISEYKKKIKPKEILEKSNNGLDNLSAQLESEYDKIGKSKTGKAIKEGTKKATETIKEVAKSGYTAQLGEALNDAFNKLKKFDIFGALISLFKGLFGMFVGNEVLKKAGEKAKEKINDTLTKENIEKTKKSIKQTLINSFPEKEKYIDSILNNPNILTKEKINSLYQKIKNGEKITLDDLAEEFKELDINKLLEEKIEAYKKTLYKKIQEEIELKYKKTLTTEQVHNLGNLISKYLTIDKTNIEHLQKKINIDNELQIKDIMPLIIESGKNSAGFMFGLITANIISINDIAMNFAEKGGELITLSLSALGLSETITIDDLYENISQMEEKDKAILIALLYRKGGLFLNILGSLSALSSKILIETILPTNSGVDGIKLLKDSLLHGNIKQIENFSKIEKALGANKEISQGSKFLEEALKNLSEVKKNFAILEIMKNSDGDLNKFYDELSKYEKAANINLGVEKYSNFDELRNGVSNNMSKKYASKHNFDLRDIKNKGLGFGIEDALNNFNKNLEKIGANQARVALGRINLNPFKKISESIDISKVSKLGDSLLFEIRSPKEAKAFLKQMNELAKKSPELIKGIFDKLPIIAIGGLAATSEEPFFESLKNELPYLLPVVGPIMMIRDAGINWKTIPPTLMKTEQAVIAGGLLTLDGYFLIKGGLKGAPSYLLKPIKDIYDISKGTIEIGQRLYKTGRVLENGKNIKTVFGEALKKTKSLKGKVKALAIIAIVGFGVVEYAFADDETGEFDKYISNGKLNKEKIKADSETLSNKEKIDLIKVILLEHSGENILKNIEYNIKNKNTISIISSNEKYQGLFFINYETKEILNQLFGITNYEFKYKKPE